MRGWLAAKPWQIYPLWRTGWRYHAIYRENRRGSRHPTEDRWIRNAEPVGRLRALYRTIAFPHEHWSGG